MGPLCPISTYGSPVTLLKLGQYGDQGTVCLAQYMYEYTHTHTHTQTKLQKLFVAGSLKRWKAIEKVTGLQIPPMSKCESQQSNEEIQVLE